MTKPISLVVCGAGLAGMQATLSVMQSCVLAGRLVRVSICDCAAIRGHNVITCPPYTTVGQPKCDRLAELIRADLGESVIVDAMYCRAEEMNWQRALPAGEDEHRVTLVCLDCWEGRIAVTEDLRLHAQQQGTVVTLIQVGLDRGLASVAVFGSGFEDPCPACGHDALPGSQPCVAFTDGGRLLRGTLRAEATAAGGVVRDIMLDMAGLSSSPQDWTNRKVNLVVNDGDTRIEQHVRQCNAAVGCLGPHTPAPPPRREQLLQTAIRNRGESHD